MTPTRNYIRPVLPSKCPWRDKVTHATRKPEILSDATVRDIEIQIALNGFPSLPYLGFAKRFYRCVECFAVWAAGSIFENASEESVCGLYNELEDEWVPFLS
jgi:hypothetical protein